MSRQVPEGFPKLVERVPRPWVCKAGNAECRRVMPCPSCLGRRNRRKGKRAQSSARHTLESVFGKLAARWWGQTANEEMWNLPVRVEVKAGAQVNAIWTRFVAAERQSDGAKAIGDARPFVMAAMPDGTTDGLIVIRISQFGEVLDLGKGIE